MFKNCQNVISRHRCTEFLCQKILGAKRVGIHDTINNLSRLCQNRISSQSQTLRPFLRQCSRQVDYVAAQRFKRGQQWIRFYTQLWSRDRLSSLMIQMGRRLGIALRHRRISTLIFSGAAFVPVKDKFENENPDEKIENKNVNHLKSEQCKKR